MKLIEVCEPFKVVQYKSSGYGGTVRQQELPFINVIVDELPKDMKAFVITSDLQGREDAPENRLLGEAVADILVELQRDGTLPKLSFLASCGDLYDHPDFRKLGGTGDVTSVLNAFADNFETVVAVHGNHDMVSEKLLPDNVHILDGTTVTIEGLSIGGVSGVMGKESRNQRKSRESYFKHLKKAVNKRNDLLLLHQAPKPDDDRKGDHEIADFFKLNGSGLVAFGHVHWSDPVTIIGRNEFLNTDARVLIVTATPL
ncbi:Metallophos domain-containing protein [Vibrio chagasii]|nr:Metallophos domain-containing protein [Vibrio chagasii]